MSNPYCKLPQSYILILSSFSGVRDNGFGKLIVADLVVVLPAEPFWAPSFENVAIDHVPEVERCDEIAVPQPSACSVYDLQTIFGSTPKKAVNNNGGFFFALVRARIRLDEEVFERLLVAAGADL